MAEEKTVYFTWSTEMAEDRKLYFTGGPQKTWNHNRIKKLSDILGEEWFKGKRVLEVASGHGDNGKALALKGSSVLFTDARQMFVDFLIEDGLDARVLNIDGAWSLGERFDLIVHWGVLYHLDKWKESLKSTLEHTDLLCIETIVAFKQDEDYEEKIPEAGYDQAVNGTGTRMSVKNFEDYITTLGATFVRYDDEDLNVNRCANYTWEAGEQGIDVVWRRRFWMVRKS